MNQSECSRRTAQLHCLEKAEFESKKRGVLDEEVG